MKQSWLYRSFDAAVVDEPGAQAVVVRLGDRPVDGAPPDLVVARRLVDDELVLRRAAGVLARPDDERAVGRDEALAMADGVLVQLGGRAGWPGRNARGRDEWSARSWPSAVDSRCTGDHGRIDRPRVMRDQRSAGVGFRSRYSAGGCYHVAAGLRSTGPAATFGQPRRGVRSVLLMVPATPATMPTTRTTRARSGRCGPMTRTTARTKQIRMTFRRIETAGEDDTDDGVQLARHDEGAERVGCLGDDEGRGEQSREVARHGHHGRAGRRPRIGRTR